MSKFQDRLWRELVQEHGARLAEMTRPAINHRRRPRPRLLASTTVGLAGVGTAVALIVSAAGSSPAFAVTRNNDGTVTVWIRRVDGIAGANARLAALGVRARAVAVAAGCKPPAGVALRPGRLIAAPKVHGNWTGVRQVVTARFDPKKIPSDRMLVLPAVSAGKQVRIAQVRAVRGPAPPCLAVFSPQAVKAIVGARTSKCHVFAPVPRANVRVRVMKLERARVVTRVGPQGLIRMQNRHGKIVQIPAPPALVAAARAAKLGCFPAFPVAAPAPASAVPGKRKR
jgi:hypothetical protein